MSVILNLLGPLFGKLLDWLPTIGAYFKGRADGAASVKSRAQAEVAKVIDAERKAEAAAPRTATAVSAALRGGKFLLAASLAAGLSACASCPPISERTVCPPVVEYPAEFQNRLADENDALPPDAALRTAMVDYGRERAALRACRGEPPS